MVYLTHIQTTLLQATPVRMDRYQPYARYLQQAKIPRKARVGIPTAKQIDTHSQYRHVREEPFHELPDSVDVDTMQWKCTGLGEQQVLEIPPEFRKLFGKEANELFTTQYEGNTGVWYAVLFGLDPEFITRTFANQQKCVRELKQQMGIELDDYYQKYKYRQYGYIKSRMDKVLTHSDEFHAMLGHYLEDFLDLNVLILLENRRYHWLGRFDEGRVTLVLHHKGLQWGAVVHPNQESHLMDTMRVKTLTDRLHHMTSLDVSQQHSSLVMDTTLLATLKRDIKAMKIRELQDRAIGLELLIDNENGRKKLKKDLQQEIYCQLTGCDDF